MSERDDALIDAAWDEASSLGAAGSPPSPPPFHVDGYRVVGPPMVGGQGVVYEAVSERTGRRVAIKVLRGGSGAGVRERARFDREVLALARLDHRAIVAIHDSGEVDGASWFAMDHVDGSPLDRWLDGEPSRDSLLRLFIDLCDGVHAAHLLGVIHRDLKPSNVMVDRRGSPRILDFGLAKVEGPVPTGELTEAGQFLGSLAWSSPEQSSGEAARVDLRTDVYALGLLLYRGLCGRHPYPVSGDVRDVLEGIASRAPVPLRSVDPSIDRDLETIVLRCLVKEPERRYQSAAGLADDLRRYRAGDAIDARRDSGLYVAGKWIARHRWIAGLAAALLLTVLVGLAVVGTLYRRAASDRDRAMSASAAAEAARRQVEEREEALRRELYFHRMLSAQVAIAEDNIEHARRMLAEAPPELRGFEWRYLSRLSDRAYRVFEGHESTATALAVDPGGGRIATGDADGLVRLLDAVTGAAVSTMAGQGAVREIAFSPDGSRAAFAFDGQTVEVVDVKPTGFTAPRGLTTGARGPRFRGVGSTAGGGGRHGRARRPRPRARAGDAVPGAPGHRARGIAGSRRAARGRRGGDRVHALAADARDGIGVDRRRDRGDRRRRLPGRSEDRGLRPRRSRDAPRPGHR